MSVAPVSYDRRATELPKHGEIRVITIYDPYSRAEVDKKTGELVAPKGIQVVQNLRDDPLAWLHERKFITTGQFQAGREWQKWFEESQFGCVRGIDYSRPKVDGAGASPDILNDKRRKAVSRLQWCRSRLGHAGDRLVRQILGERMSLEDVAQREGLNGKRGSRDMVFLGRLMRHHLQQLAIGLGFEK